VLGDLGILGAWCERCASGEQRKLCGLREVCEFRERRVLSERRANIADSAAMAASACKLGHGKPRDGDGKVEQGVQGAQVHEDTLL